MNGLKLRNFEQDRWYDVFQKPLSWEKYEGNAKTIRKLEVVDEPMEYWLVQFRGDDGPVKRWLNRMDLNSLNLSDFENNIDIRLGMSGTCRAWNKEDCLGAVRQCSDAKNNIELDAGNCEECRFFRGHNIPDIGKRDYYPGDKVKGCCWRKQLNEKGWINEKPITKNQ